jgi:hypothetical protein
MTRRRCAESGLWDALSLLAHFPLTGEWRVVGLCRPCAALACLEEEMLVQSTEWRFGAN